MTHGRRGVGAVALCLGLWLALSASGVAAQEQPTTGQVVEKLVADAKAAYNGERYEKAAELYRRAAQVDPAGKRLSGSPYRDLGRCMFWLERYDQSVFWYQVYLRNQPDAKDRDQVTSELDAANARRSSPERRPGPEVVYDKSVLQLIDALETRLSRHEPAYTEGGGGTSRLYVLALERGYALPDLAIYARDLRKGLLAELEARFARPARAPLPVLGESSEPLEASAYRLDLLRELATTTGESEKLAGFQLLVDAFGAYSAGRFPQAVEGFDAAAGAFPSLDYLPVIKALAQLRAGDAKGSIETLDKARPALPAELHPWADVVRAEALRAQGDLVGAAGIFMAVLAPEGAKVKTIEEATDGKVKTVEEAGEEQGGKTVKTLGGSVGDKKVKKIEPSPEPSPAP